MGFTNDGLHRIFKHLTAYFLQPLLLGLTRRARFTPLHLTGFPVYFVATPDPRYNNHVNRAVCKYHASSSVCMPTKVALDDIRWSQAPASGPGHRLQHCQKKREKVLALVTCSARLLEAGQ